MRLYIGLLLVFGFISCEPKTVICDTSFQVNTVYSPDTLIFYSVRDYDSGDLLYLDSNVVGDIFVIDDSYLSVMGKNEYKTINITYTQTDMFDAHVVGVCTWSDDCHVYISKNLDTLR